MSEPLSKPSLPSSPPRPLHRMNRSITEVSPPAHKIHRPHHLHNPSHHSHHFGARRARSNDKERKHDREPQSAHPNLQPFLSSEGRWKDGHREVKSEFGTPADSANVSRRASGATWDPDFGGVSGVSPLPFLKERRFIKDGEVREEREKGVLRATELRNLMINLNTLSNETTRRLDITYYTILEKLSFLQSSIASLKEVATLTQDINTDFQAESEELVQEMNEQLEGFSNFESQERRIKDLADRVQTGRETIQSLGQRVDVIKKKVEGYERAEGEWQDKTRRRLRVMWIVMSVIAAIVIGLVLFRYTPAKTYGPGVIHGLNATGLRIPGMDGVIGNESWSLRREKDGEGVLERLRKKQGERVEEDPRLRVFDEL